MHSAIVILNWNTVDYLRSFLPGLLDSVKDADAEVIVADSASTDSSMAMMQSEFPSVRRIELDKNYGFTGGYNRALAGIDAELFVLMNSDIEVTPDWFKPLAEWMESHPDCGACAPKLHSWYDRDSFEYAGAAGGRIDRWGYPFCRGRVMNKLEKDEGQYDSPAYVFWASGACLMVRSSLWKQLGGLDDRFFAHMEEIDLCWRMQLEGCRISIVPESLVYHIGGGTLPKSSPWKLKLNYRNNLLMLDNNLAKSFVADGLSPRKALQKARRIIFLRMILDGGSALMYLLTGKASYFKAVIEAHREFKRLRRGSDAAQLANWAEQLPPEGICIEGRYSGSMILASILKGNDVFKYLEKRQ